ncbi:MAG TPA: hypothetical protein VHS54_07390 [Jatrophihabitans sp.]|nr:hypothetical protein [Jatrophihabitans sp.]
MSKLAKVVTATVVAALLVAVPAFPTVAGARAAHATHTHTHATKHTHKTKPAVHDRLAGPRRGASHAIAAQSKAVARLVANASGLTLSDGAALGSALAADQAALQSDLAAVADATSVRALRVLVAAAGTTRQLARMQFQVVVAADTAAAQAAATSTTVADLVAKLSDPTIVDPAVLDPAAGLLAMADASTQLSSATAAANLAVTTMLALSPSAARADSHVAYAAAEASLEAAGTALLAAATDVTDVQTAYSL